MGTTKETGMKMGILKNRGQLQMDATDADQEIKYPTDHDLLNDSRSISERVIDFLSDALRLEKKPRTYRRKARKDFLIQSKKRKTEFNERNHVEGKFGQAKRLDTSQSWVSCIIFVLNLLRLKQIFMPLAQMSISSINMYSIWKMMLKKMFGYEKQTKFAFSVF